jgi:ribosomal protein L34
MRKANEALNHETHIPAVHRSSQEDPRFRVRMKTASGRAIISARRAKGRKRIAV